MHTILLLSSLLLSNFFHLVKGALGEHGLLVVESGQEGVEDQAFCLIYYPGLYQIETNVTLATRYPISALKDLNETNTCDDGDDLEDLGLLDTFPIFTSNLTFANCSLAEKVSRLQEFKVLGMISEGNYGKNFNSSLYNLTVPFGAIVERIAKQKLMQMQKQYPHANFYVYGTDINFDPSTLVIFLMAVVTVTLGSLWSGYAKQHLRLRKESQVSRVEVGGQGDVVKPQDGAAHEEDLAVRVSPILIMFFVFCMCSMLVLLYFFFDQLVYVIMVMFCIASSLAMYSCFEPLVMATYNLPIPVLRLPKANLFFCRLDLELRQLLLLLVSLGTSVVWFVFRKTDWSWMLQDFLGILFSINMLKVLRLPSLKICTCLLSALFFYDIFFVFITPLFMKDGKSVMVEVATGHNSGEQLPMVLRVPHLNHDPCYLYTYSLLGFGDILVPGLLLAFCHGFDLMVGSPWKLYWVLSCVCYTLGLVATFISLYLMNSAQPALLYLVPFTLIPISLVAWCRGELKAMWEGDIQESNEEVYDNLETDDDDDNPNLDKSD